MSSATNYRERLLAIYEACAPSKVHQVDALLRKYHGREEALIAAAAQKYAAHAASSQSNEEEREAAAPSEAAPQSPPQQTTTTATAPDGDGASTSYHNRLRRIYEKYTQRRVPFVDRDLAKYPGREEDVIRAAVRKYGPEPTSPVAPVRTGGGEETEGHSPPERARTRAESEAAPDYRARVTQLYTEFAPQRLPRVEHELVKYKGREEALIRAIEAKYVKTSPPPPPPPASLAEPHQREAAEAPIPVAVVSAPLSTEANASAEAVPPAAPSPPTPSPPQQMPQGGESGADTANGAGTAATAPEANEPTARGEEVADNDYRTRITNLYTQYAPQRLARVEHELVKYEGREEALLHAIEAKYANPASSPPSPPPSPPPAAAAAAAALAPAAASEAQQNVDSSPSPPASLTETAPPHASVYNTLAERQHEDAEAAEQGQAERLAEEEEEQRRELMFVANRSPSRSSSSEARETSQDGTAAQPWFTITPAAAAASEEKAEDEAGDADEQVAPGHEEKDLLVAEVAPLEGKQRDESKVQWIPDSTPLTTAPAAVVSQPTALEPSPTPLLSQAEGEPHQQETPPPTPPSAGDGAAAATPPATESKDERDVAGGGKTSFSFPSVLLHDVFHSLGTSRIRGIDMVSRVTCVALLREAMGVHVNPADPPSRAVADAVEAYLGGDFVSEAQFTAFLYAYGAAHYWTNREAEYHMRKSEAFLAKCRNAMLVDQTLDPDASATHCLTSARQARRMHLSRTGQELSSSAARELRSGFWLHYCVFPCVLPSWKRCWAFLTISKLSPSPVQMGEKGPPRLSRLSICYPGSTKVDMSIPFEKVESCFLESMLPRNAMTVAAAGGVGAAPPPSYGRNGLVIRLAGGPNPLEVRLCSEEMRHAQGILKAFQCWQKSQPPQAPSSSGVAADVWHTPSPRRDERSSLYSPGEVSVTASDLVPRDLSWIHLWVCQGSAADTGPSVERDFGPTPQPFAWAFYEGRLLQRRRSKARSPGGSPAASTVKTMPAWDIGAELVEVASVKELPVGPPPGNGKVHYPFVLHCHGSERPVFAWAASRAERAAIISELKRLQLRHKLLSVPQGTSSSTVGWTGNDLERALSYPPPMASA